MQGTSQRHPSLTDQRPRPRTESSTELRATASESRTRQPDDRQATDGRGARTEFAELVLLFAILLGCMALAGAIL